jgi:hypothetical protein
MYLPVDFSHPIFVVVKKKQQSLKFPKEHIRTVLGVLCLIIAVLPLQSQQVWPGDVSGNGFVDHQDVLFWAYARGTSGAERPNGSSEFIGQEVDLTDWLGNFPGTARNFAYADCNGDGVVNDEDLATIREYYYLPAGEGSGTDEFLISDGPVASQLLLGNSSTIDVEAGEVTTIPFNLATQDTQDIEIAYLGFQLNYGTELIAEGQNGELLLSLDLDIEGNEWIQENISVFIHHHENLGFSDLVFYMDTPGDFVVGKGAIAEFSIVVEEVVFGLQDININSPVILDADFIRPGYTSSQGIVINLIGKPVSANEEALPLTAVRVFPNPVNTGVLHAQLNGDAATVIERMELFDQTGRLITSQEIGARTGQLNASKLSEGLYVLKVVTDAGVRALQVKATR